MSKKKSKRIKLRLFPILVFLIFVLSGYFVVTLLIDTRIKNIYVIGNDLLTDQQIIEIAKLDDYPSFYKTLSRKIKNDLKKSEYIKDVKVKKEVLNVLKIYVTEYKPVFIYNDQLILENKKSVDYIQKKVPVFSGNISQKVFNSLIDKIIEIDQNTMKNVSQIIYAPSEYDNERFLLYMDDGNEVYINLVKFSKLNYYREIYPTLNGKKGTLYLDSGNHFEVFK